MKDFLKPLKEIFENFDREYHFGPELLCGECKICCTNKVKYPKISRLEYDLIKDFLKKNEPEQSLEIFKEYMTDSKINTCPCYDKEKKCLIYPVRPFCCRVFGIFGFENDRSVPLPDNCIFHKTRQQLGERDKYEKIKGLSDFMELIRKYDIMQSGNDLEKINELISLGEEYMRQDKLDKALSFFHEAKKINSLEPRTHYNIGNIYRSQGNIKKAKENLEKSLVLEGDKIYPYIYQNLGFICLDLNEPELSAAYFKKAIEKESTKAMPYIGMAFAEWKRGNEKKAGKNCSIALKIEPHNEIALNMAKCFNI